MKAINKIGIIESMIVISAALLYLNTKLFPWDFIAFMSICFGSVYIAARLQTILEKEEELNKLEVKK